MLVLLFYFPFVVKDNAVKDISTHSINVVDASAENKLSYAYAAPKIMLETINARTAMVGI